ncbi:class I SAM-dependent methyltransferase [Inhella proteolytica]|uniref:Class I SAM-dependent methyltransferase n=1 Tax=Inhella proteolytica TaxID=2795029 RepID=A0A931NF96_9BURK|nr:class I SAM-dependent methyltransferase [Inhella proteolytica]MBH9575866.1 class I SAM-dependent methyltransferase [Inhella proteolytica]
MAEGLARLWPLSALLSWALAWSAWQAFGPDWPGGLALLAVSLACALLHRRPWRRLWVALGLPLGLLLSQAALPAGFWLVLAVALLALYPRRLWGDAPLFLTPRGALTDLGTHLQLPGAPRVLDAGCGSGAGLRALRAALPAAQLAGTEASWPLALWARWRCPWARVRRGDMWADSWRELDLLYLFQRPETMTRVLAKARTELPPGAWLLSLDFELPGIRPHAQWPSIGRHQLFLYRAEDLN